MTVHDDKFEQVCQPMFSQISDRLTHIVKLLDGTNGTPGIRLEMDRLKQLQLAQAARGTELSGIRGRIVSGVLVAILLAIGSAFVSAAMQFKTYEMVRAVNEQGRVAPLVVAAPQPTGGNAP